MRPRITHFDVDEIDGDGRSPRAPAPIVWEAEPEQPPVLARVAFIAALMLCFALVFGWGSVQLLRVFGE